MILLDGGLRTSIATFRTGLKPAIARATPGVLMTAAITALAAVWLLEMDLRTGMLLGAVVGSTDAAAVFAAHARRRPPVAGDTVGHAHAVFVVRAVDEHGHIVRVGLGLLAQAR